MAEDMVGSRSGGGHGGQGCGGGCGCGRGSYHFYDRDEWESFSSEKKAAINKKRRLERSSLKCQVVMLERRVQEMAKKQSGPDKEGESVDDNNKEGQLCINAAAGLAFEGRAEAKRKTNKK